MSTRDIAIISGSKVGGHTFEGVLRGEQSAREDSGVARQLADFNALYREYARFVFSMLRRLNVPECAVDDALQEVFLVAYRRRRSFDEEASLRSWIYGITIRVARSHYRRAALRRVLFFPLRENDDVVTHESGYEHVENREALALVDSLLKRIPRKQREVFVLAEIEELTAQEIAPIVGCNVNTVYSRLRLARRRFESSAAAHRALESSRRVS